MKVVSINDYKCNPSFTFKKCRFFHKYKMVESTEVRTCFCDYAAAKLLICKECGKRKITKSTLTKLTAGHQVALNKWLLGECHDLYYAENHNSLRGKIGDYSGDKWRYAVRQYLKEIKK
jgi:hypothetical protein